MGWKDIIPGDNVSRLYLGSYQDVSVIETNYPSPADGSFAYAESADGWSWGRRSGWYQFVAGSWGRSGNQNLTVLDDELYIQDDTTGNKLRISTDDITSDRTLTAPDGDGTIALNKGQTVTVAKTGGDFTSVKSAYDSITDQSASKRYVVEVNAGVYVEQSILARDYISIIGRSASQCIIVASDVNNTLITMADNMSIISLTITGITNGKAISNTTDGNASFTKDIIIDNSLSGIYTSGTTDMTCINTKFSSSVTTGFEVDGTTVAPVNYTGIIASGVISEATTTFKTSSGVANKGLIRLFNAGVFGGNQAIDADGGVIDIHILCISNCPNIIKTDNNAFVSGFGVDAHYVTGNHIEQLDTTDDIILWGSSLDQDQLIIANAENVKIDFNDKKDGDEGLTLYKELKVGSPELGHESVMGGGDSYTRGLLAYSFDGVSTYTDISEDVKSYEGSTFSFDGVGIDNAIYVASSLTDGTDYLKHFGIKALIDTGAVLGTGEIIPEYWNGTSWVELHTMSTLSSSPYTRYAEDIFQRTGSEQVRYSPHMNVDWVKNDPMSLGTSYYWMRYRIDSAITTAPVFEQFKLHTSRTEINADGFIEYFGVARPRGSIDFNYNTNQAFSASPATQDTWLYDSDDVGQYKDMGFGGIRNEFADGVNDISTNVFVLPPDLDSSGIFRVEIFWYAQTTGDVYFHFSSGLRGEGETIGWTAGTAPFQSDPSGSMRNYFTAEGATPCTAGGTIQKFEIDLPVDQVIENDILWITIAREGGNVLDTLGSNAYIIQTKATYLKWSQGGYVV